jgi:Flp pilus assembly protein TadD
MQQERYKEARTELVQAASQDPDDPVTHALLSICHSHEKNHKDAIAAGERAVALAPDFDFAHQVLAMTLAEAGKLRRAEQHGRQAVTLDPQDPDNLASLAYILALQSKWEESLALSEAGLAQDAAHSWCANLRAQALSVLGKKDDAAFAAQELLSDDPEQAHSQANVGWVMLRQGRHQEAVQHFREALRLDPELEHAREGILAALRAKFPPYRWLLGFFFWLSRFSPGTRWAIVLGLFIGMRLLRGFARENPEWAPFILPVAILYSLFVFFSWIAEPLLNVTLFLHPIGRIALTKQERAEARWMGLLFLTGTGLSLAAWLLGRPSPAIPLLAAFFGMLLVGLASLLRSYPAVRRWAVMFLGATFLVITLFMGLALVLIDPLR